MAVVTAAAPAYLWHSQSQSRSGRAHSPQAGHPPTCRWAWARQHPSPSELNAPTPAASKRSASFFFKAKIGVFVPFSAAYARWLMPVNRALKSARAPCALFAALEAKHHHHPQLARRCTSPPPVPRSVPATICGCSCSCAFIAGRRLHELGNTQQEAGSRYPVSPPLTSVCSPFGARTCRCNNRIHVGNRM
jgi:hypothetical protein